MPCHCTLGLWLKWNSQLSSPLKEASRTHHLCISPSLQPNQTKSDWTRLNRTKSKKTYTAYFVKKSHGGKCAIVLGWTMILIFCIFNNYIRNVGDVEILLNIRDERNQRRLGSLVGWIYYWHIKSCQDQNYNLNINKFSYF